MRATLKERLFSPYGMNIVNACFALMAFLHNPLATIGAYLTWLAFLAYTIRHTPYTTTKVLYGVLVCFALFVIAANLYALAGLFA